MLIQEAIKSGKPFKRKCEKNWTWTKVHPSPNVVGGVFVFCKPLPKRIIKIAGKLSANPGIIGILANDWEIKQ
jgi:hypothetical protein